MATTMDRFTPSRAPVKRVKSIQFGIWNPEEIVSGSKPIAWSPSKASLAHSMQQACGAAWRRSFACCMLLDRVHTSHKTAVSCAQRHLHLLPIV